jgi:hypothetical protein
MEPKLKAQPGETLLLTSQRIHRNPRCHRRSLGGFPVRLYQAKRQRVPRPPVPPSHPGGRRFSGGHGFESSPRAQSSGRFGALVGLLLRDVAGSFGSSRALMSIIKVTASRAAALVAPAHAQSHDGDYSQDNEGNHDHNNSCLDGDRNHQGLALLLPLPSVAFRATRYPRAGRPRERRLDLMPTFG